MLFQFTCVLVTLLGWAECNNGHGVQMRLTENGMFYAVDVGIKIMQEDLKKNVINERGTSGDLQYNLQNLRISKAEFKNYELSPVSGTGMRGKVSGISINGAGKLWYKYKKGWFKFSDTIDVELKTENIHFDMTLDIGADAKGRPTIAMQSCSAGVTDIDLKFHGGASWLYNLFSSVIEKRLKKSFGDLLCTIAKKEINTKAKSELATFPVVKKIDKYAEIDYRLTKIPAFTSQYMDACLKGEFKSVTSPVESKLTPITFSASSSTNKKMIYFWVTDYTVNTAGEVYHKSGRLSEAFAAWDSKVPSVLKSMLNTNKFQLLFPKLGAQYPNAPMAIDLHSYKAPSVTIQPNNIMLNLHVHAQFKVRDSQKKIVDVFSVKFDVATKLTIGVKGDNINGKITSFDYDAKVDKSNVGKITIPLDSPLIKLMLEHTVVAKANPLLGKGFPLPKVDQVSLVDFDVLLEKNVIRIGTNLKYVK